MVDENISVLIQISVKFVPKDPIDNRSCSISLDIGLAPTRRRAITWINCVCVCVCVCGCVRHYDSTSYSLVHEDIVTIIISFDEYIITPAPTVCVSVRPCVCTITHHSLFVQAGITKFGPEVKIPIVCGSITRDLQSQIKLKSPNLPHLELVCTITHHPFKQKLNLG